MQNRKRRFGQKPPINASTLLEVSAANLKSKYCIHTPDCDWERGDCGELCGETRSRSSWSWSPERRISAFASSWRIASADRSLMARSTSPAWRPARAATLAGCTSFTSRGESRPSASSTPPCSVKPQDCPLFARERYTRTSCIAACTDMSSDDGLLEYEYIQSQHNELLLL